VMALRVQTFALLILFIAVLWAYHQKHKNAAIAPGMNTTAPVQGPQLPVAEPPAPSSTFNPIIQEAKGAMHHIPPLSHMPHLPHIPLEPIPMPTLPTLPRIQKPHAPSAPKVNIFRYLTYIPSPIPFIRSILTVQFRIVSFLVSTTVELFHALFAPMRILLAPVIVLLTAVFNILVLTPYRVIFYLGKLLYPIYVFVGTAVVLGACVGVAGGVFHTAVIIPTVEPEAEKRRRTSLKNKTRAKPLQDVPPLSFPEHEKLRDVTKWVEESW